MRNMLRAFISLISMSLLIGGCASREELAKRIAGRWGPDPVINADDANTTIQRQLTVLRYAADGAGYTTLPSTNETRWSDVAAWGFNIGREDCASYLNNLFKIQREKLRNHGVITAAQTASIGIVTAAAPHAATAISVLGQAFGLASSLNDAILDSYLFTEAPGLISIKVKQLQDDYQNSLSPNSINSAAQAYSALQNYYNICLPQTIEGVILQKVATSGTTSGDTGTPKTPAATKKLTVAPKDTSITIQKTPLLTN